MSDLNLEQKTKSSLKLVSAFFAKQNVNWWLEAGTALAAWRDKALMDWDHDIDIAIWYEDCPSLQEWDLFFAKTPFKVVIQKNFPYLDNIIQLRPIDRSNTNLIDVDIYLYKQLGDKAYMRWIHVPIGLFSPIKAMLIKSLAQIAKPQTPRWERLSQITPNWLSDSLFWGYLWVHIQTTSCVYHQFPKTYFSELREIKFYGISVHIAGDTDNYLAHRYGPDWRQPDPQFNQKGRWKLSGARRKLPLRLLPMPQKLKN